MDNTNEPGGREITAASHSGPTMAVTPEGHEPIMKFFAWEHLPPKLIDVSKPFGQLAERIVREIPRSAERTVALRKLLESKDAAVRAAL